MRRGSILIFLFTVGALTALGFIVEKIPPFHIRPILVTTTAAVLLIPIFEWLQKKFGGEAAGKFVVAAFMADFYLSIIANFTSGISVRILWSWANSLKGKIPFEYTGIGSWNVWVQVLFILVYLDFTGYWLHRALHSEYLWPFHAVHHSSKRFTWHSSVRFHPFDDFFMRFGPLIPLVLFGVSFKALFIITMLLVLHPLFVHMSLPWTFGKLSKVFVGPASHRVHHALASRDGNKNYAGFFSFWDMIFGTYQRPDLEMKEKIGIEENPKDSVWTLLLFPFVKNSK